MNYSSIILAAGTSGRMGIPKLDLRFDENHNFAEQLCESFNTPECKKIILVVNNYGAELIKTKNFVLPDKTEIVINNHTERGRFYSLKCGLIKCDPTLPFFFTNIDNPFIEEGFLTNLLPNLNDADYICPSFNNKGGHPVLISPTIISDILSQDDNTLDLKTFLKKYRRKNIEFKNRKILANINTPEDYKRWIG
jgi:CTP:molybdopterin cytidylyltransferase MocA